MGVPLPKGQRGLLVTAAVVGARSQVEVEQVSGMLTQVIASQQAQPLLDPFVLLCRVASHSSASQVEEMAPLVAVEQQKKEREQRSAAAMPIVVVAGTGCVLDASRRVRQWALQWWRWFVMAVHSSCSVVSSQT